MRKTKSAIIALSTLFVLWAPAANAQCDSACTNAGPNLLTNGDFELGNTGFTSSYMFAASAAQGNYGITQNTNLYVASQWCNSYDHTSGSGNYMWIDGSTVSQTIWSETVFVNPNIDYYFSFWGMNLSIPFSGGTMEFVDVYINGVLIEANIELNSADCFWIQKCVGWNSGSATSATIEIKNTNAHSMGNDLAFDDLTFRSCNETVACNNPGTNLVANPGFELGNTGFTSDYVFAASAAQGNYGLTQNANMYVASQWCNAFDHTSGSGNYLWIDGAVVQQTIWEETMTVTPNTDYNFSFWGMNLSIPYSGGIYEFVDVYINGILVSANINMNTADCIWEQEIVTWNSGSATTATVEIRNTNAHYMGNDLAFDDISFTSCNEAITVCGSVCTSPTANLLSNPGFESGNTGFTSSYIYTTAAGQGNYGITQNTGMFVASQWCNSYDHTSGSGNYLWVDGAASVQTIWSETVTVTPNTDYSFSFWGMNLSIPYSGGTMEFVDVYINGTLVAGNLDLNSADCFWVQNCASWNSGSATSASIEIKNTNTHYMGNDLAFDDMVFMGCANGLGMNEFSNQIDVNVYPNPTNNFLNIENFNNENLVLSLFDVAGNLIMTSTMHNGVKTFDLSAFAEGMYLLRSINESGSAKTFKIQVVK